MTQSLPAFAKARNREGDCRAQVVESPGRETRPAQQSRTMQLRAPRFSTVFVLLILLISLCVPAKAQGTVPQTTLAEADRLAMLYNWPRALPLYAEAETEFRRLNDPRGVLKARLGWLRAEAYEEPAPALAAEVDRDLRNSVVQGDAGLMLRCLAAKAAIEEQVNEDCSRSAWEKIQELAKRLNDRRWQARAQAELGIIAFLDGDVATTTQALKTALVSLYLQGDMGTAIYYGSIVGNGQVEAGQPEAGIKYRRKSSWTDCLAPERRGKAGAGRGHSPSPGAKCACG